MGSYDDAKTCKLLGNFLLSQLQDLSIKVGLYRDDGLAITNATPGNTDNIKKEICGIFNNNGLRITIEANKQVINFLDVTFNLNQSTYLGISHLQSPTLHYSMFTTRATTHRSPQRTFPPASTNNCHHYHPTRHHLTKPPSIPKSTRPKRIPLPPKLRTKQQRNNILWYNPQFSKNISTNIGHRFLALVDNHFPRDHKLRKNLQSQHHQDQLQLHEQHEQIISNHNELHNHNSLLFRGFNCHF